MRLMCPECAAVCSLTAWQNAADQREFDRILSELPSSVSRYCLHYLSLFRPRPSKGIGKGLIMPKALRLIGELRQLVSESHIRWKRQPARPIDPILWGQAMERMLEHPPEDLPITSHGYLKSIAYKLADKADRVRETDHNRRERSGQVLPSHEATERAGGELEPISVDLMRQIADQKLRRKR